MMIYFEPATMCGMKPELVIAPLPGKRQLWQASDEFTWNTECERDPTYQVRYALASDGELVKLDQDSAHSSDMVHHNGPGASQCCPRDCPSLCDERPITSEKVVEWKEWCSGMDDLGGLVMLAASFVV